MEGAEADLSPTPWIKCLPETFLSVTSPLSIFSSITRSRLLTISEKSFKNSSVLEECAGISSRMVNPFTFNLNTFFLGDLLNNSFAMLLNRHTPR